MPPVRRNQDRRGVANTRSATTVAAPPPPAIEDEPVIPAVPDAPIAPLIHPKVAPNQAIIPVHQGQQVSAIQVVVNKVINMCISDLEEPRITLKLTPQKYIWQSQIETYLSMCFTACRKVSCFTNTVLFQVWFCNCIKIVM